MFFRKLSTLVTLGLFTAIFSTTQAGAASLAIFDAHLMGGWTGASAERTSGGGATFNSSKAMSYGLGAGIELPLAESLGIVTGLDFVHRKFEIGSSTARVERTVATAFIPVMLRGWVSDAFYLQGGVYASKGIGNVKDDFKIGDSSVFDFDSSERRAVDFGALAGLGMNLAFFGKTGIYVQGQYMHGLTDSSGSTLYSERVRDVIVSTGIRIEI